MDALDPNNPLRPHVRHLDQQRTFWRTKYEDFKAHREKHTTTLVTVGEAFAGAAIAGVVNGRYGGEKGVAAIGGVPISPIVSGVLVALGMFDVAGHKFSDHFINFGIGGLAEFGANWAFGLGQRWRESGHLFEFHHHAPGPLPPGTHASGDLSPEAINEIARSLPR